MKLESAEIYKTLSGVFWDTINQDELLAPTVLIQMG